MKEREFLKRVKECKGMVFKLIYYYTDDREEAKDWLQEILYQSWKSYPTFNNHSKFSTWFYKIAINTILSQKKLYSIQKAEYKDEIQTISNLDRFENKEKLDWAIKQLNPEHRFLIHLYFEGYSHEEIAELIGIKSNAVGVKIFRIKQHLKNLLQNHD